MDGLEVANLISQARADHIAGAQVGDTPTLVQQAAEVKNLVHQENPAGDLYLYKNEEGFPLAIKMILFSVTVMSIMILVCKANGY